MREQRKEVPEGDSSTNQKRKIELFWTGIDYRIDILTKMFWNKRSCVD